MTNLQKISSLALTLLITGSIDSIRNLPAAALFGSSLIFFFTLAAILFLIPTALVSADLTANLSEGGIYQWCRLAFGEKVGFLAVYLQWINNVVWFPTILSFIAGTAAYLIDPALAQHKCYLISVILIVFWLLTFMNLKGVRLSAKFTSLCALLGLIIPMTTIIGLFIVWVFLKKPMQIHFTMQSILPDFKHVENWTALTAIMLSFTGMELATVHIKDVNDPKKSFPRALTFSTFIILITMIAGSVAIACVLPHDKINLVNGTIETFSYFLSAYHLGWLLPLMTILLVIGSLGGMISWVISPIKGLSQAANHGFLPPFFQRLNRHGVAQNLLLTQASLVSLICLAFLLFPGVNGSYWLLTALSTQLYMFMYILMFLAALRLRKKMPYTENTFRIPGKKIGFALACLFGLMGCLVTIGIGFIPPVNLNIGSGWYYQIIFCTGMLTMTLPIYFFYRYARAQQMKIKSTLLAISQVNLE